MSDKRRGLGRGLGALIPTAPTTDRADRPVDVFFPEPGNGRENVDTGSAVGAGEHGSPETSQDRPYGPGAGEDGMQPGPGEALAPEGHVAPASHEDAPRASLSAVDAAVMEPAPEVSRETAGDPGAAMRTADALIEAAASVDGVSRETATPPADQHGTAHAEGHRREFATAAGETDLLPVPGARFAELPVESIAPNPRQPRAVFDEDEMAELVLSVAEVGVLQPVVVRPVEAAPDGSARFELVMGERRWRASQQAGLAFVPAIVRETGDDDLLRDALLENLHRSSLNPLEEAAAYSQLLEDFGCTHDVLATRIGRSRPQISNTLRLLRLPPLVQRRVAAGVLSAGHARALLGLEDAAAIERLAQRVVAEGLSVRAVEEIVALGGDDVPVRRPRAPRAGNRHPALDELAQRLSDRFDTRVQIALGRRKGRLSVEFASVEDLNRILQLLAPGDVATQGLDAGSPGGDGVRSPDRVLGATGGDAALEGSISEGARHGRDDEERAAG